MFDRDGKIKILNECDNRYPIPNIDIINEAYPHISEEAILHAMERYHLEQIQSYDNDMISCIESAINERGMKKGSWKEGGELIEGHPNSIELLPVIKNAMIKYATIFNKRFIDNTVGFDKEVFEAVEKLKWKVISLNGKICIVYDIVRNPRSIYVKHDNYYLMPGVKAPKYEFEVWGWWGSCLAEIILQISNSLIQIGLHNKVKKLSDINDDVIKKWIERGYYTFGHSWTDNLDFIASLAINDVRDVELDYYQILDEDDFGDSKHTDDEL